MINKYSKPTVTLHWINGALLVLLLFTGTFILSEIPNGLEKIDSFRMHMILGIVTLIVSIVRIANIIKTEEPEKLQMSSFRTKMMKFNHIAIYVVIIGIGISGILLARTSSLGEIVFFGADKEIYSHMSDFIVGITHGILTKVLIALIIMHIAGVIAYSLQKRNIIKRMWF